MKDRRARGKHHGQRRQSVVDTVSTTLSAAVSSKQITETLPVSRSLGAVFSTIPDRPDRPTQEPAACERRTDSLRRVWPDDGDDRRRQRRQANGLDAGFGPDLSSMEEVELVTLGGGADQMAPGTAAKLTIKSGGNNFHGRRAQEAGRSLPVQQRHRRALCPGDSSGRRSSSRAATSLADLGGPILKDRIWFFGAIRYFKERVRHPGIRHAPGLTASTTRPTTFRVPIRSSPTTGRERHLSGVPQLQDRRVLFQEHAG